MVPELRERFTFLDYRAFIGERKPESFFLVSHTKEKRGDLITTTNYGVADLCCEQISVMHPVLSRDVIIKNLLQVEVAPKRSSKEAKA